MRGLRPLSPSGLSVAAQWGFGRSGWKDHPLPLIRVVLGSGTGSEELSGSTLSILEMGGELALLARKWISWLGNVLGGSDP